MSRPTLTWRLGSARWTGTARLISGVKTFLLKSAFLSMNILLDTNACIAIINGSPPAVRSQLLSARRGGNEIFLSSIVIYELHFGVAKSHPNRKDANAKKLNIFLANPFHVLPFTTADSAVAARVRADLEKVGKPIGAYDLLIAAQAIANHLTLITADESEFSRIAGLRWKNLSNS